MPITIVKPSAFLITPVSHLTDYEYLLEEAGRTCYKSESRIGEGTAARFLKTIINSGHESVIEHCSVTYRIVCSRACSHQLVRHRIAAYSQESQRYCDYVKGSEALGVVGAGQPSLQIIVPPSIQTNPTMLEHFINHAEHSYAWYTTMREAGIPPEDARFVLPNCTKTEIVATYNIRQWRHVIRERAMNPHAQWEIRQIMLDVLYELNHYLPTLFGDLVETLKERREKA